VAVEKERTLVTCCFCESLHSKGGQKDHGLLISINTVGICWQEDGGISCGDLLWGQLGHLLFIPPSGKLLLIALGEQQ